MGIAARVQAAIQAGGVPIEDVSIGDKQVRSTWKIRPASLQAAAQPIIDAYVEPTATQMLDEDAQRGVNDRKLQAVALALWECIPNPLMTKAQMKARAVAIYKALANA